MLFFSSVFSRVQKFLKNNTFASLTLFFSTALIAIYFRKLISVDELPGLDTPVHFSSLNVLINDILPTGNWYGYSERWFGGAPLFVTYSPMYYLVVSAIYSVVHIPLALLFRLSFLVGLLFFPSIFYFMVAATYGKKVASLAPLFSLFYIFYPLQRAFQGLGAGSLVLSGLVTNWFGLLLIMVLFGCFQLVQRRDSYIYVYISGLVFGLLITTHLITSILAGGLWIYFLLVTLKNKHIRAKFFVIFFLALVLSMWWWIPFLRYVPFTNSELSGANTGGRTVFFSLFPVLPFIIDQMSFYHIVFPSIVIMMFGVRTIFDSIWHQNRIEVPILFVSLYLFLSAEIGPVLLPSFRFHYQRLLPFLYILFLLLAVKGSFQFIFERKRKKTQFLLHLFLFIVVLYQVILFPVSQSLAFSDTGLLQLHTVPVYWKWTETDLSKSYQHLQQRLVKYDAKRIYPELPALDGFLDLGSSHFFTAKIPLDTGKNVISGLFAESAPLTPYFMPLNNVLSNDRMQAWGFSRIKNLAYFRNQHPMIQVDRLQHLGVDSVVVVTAELQNVFDQLPEGRVNHKEEFGEITLYTLNETPLLVEPLEKADTFIFFDFDTNLDFSDISQSFFAHPSLFNMYLVNGGKDIEYWSSNQDLFRGMVIAANSLSNKQRATLEKINKPILLLNPRPQTQEWASNQDTVFSILYVSPIDQIDENTFSPKVWQEIAVWFDELEDTSVGQKNHLTAQKNLDESAEAIFNLKSYQDTRVRFSTSVPVIIRKGYTPDWRCRGNTCQIFQVSPSFFAVFPDKQQPEYIFEYTRPTYERMLQLVSCSVIIAIVVVLSVSIIKSGRGRRL